MWLPKEDSYLFIQFIRKLIIIIITTFKYKLHAHAMRILCPEEEKQFFVSSDVYEEHLMVISVKVTFNFKNFKVFFSIVIW